MSSVRQQTTIMDSKNIPLQDASLDIWDKKYRLKSKTGEVLDENVEQTWERVATALADVEVTPELRQHWKEQLSLIHI